MARRVMLLVAALVLAGCSGSGESDATDIPSAGPTSARVDEDTGAVQGRIVDDKDAPVAGALVALDRSEGQRTTNSTEDGSFLVEGLLPGAYRLLVQKLGFAAYGSAVNVTAGQVAMVEIKLTPLEVAPSGPLELDVYGVQTNGGWFQVAYAEASKRMPPGFRAKPHVLADPNDQTAEYSVYVTSYKNGTLDGTTAIGPGFWAFEVFSVDAPAPHASGSTVEFVLVASYASDPAVVEVFNRWNLPTKQAEITFTGTEAGPSSWRTVSSVKTERGTYTLTTGSSGNTDTVAGTSLTVRLFGIANGTVLNYVDLTISPVLYSISGAAVIEGGAYLGVNPPAPTGEGYMQWGPSTRQLMAFQPAKKGAS